GCRFIRSNPDLYCGNRDLRGRRNVLRYLGRWSTAAWRAAVPRSRRSNCKRDSSEAQLASTDPAPKNVAIGFRGAEGPAPLYLQAKDVSAFRRLGGSAGRRRGQAAMPLLPGLEQPISIGPQRLAGLRSLAV